MTMPRETFTTQKRAKARKLFDEGHGCNAIARELGLSPAAISRWAKDEGLAFNRSQSALAVRAHTIDLAESRMLLAKKMQQAAHDMLDMLDNPFEVFNFGGKDNTFNSSTLDAPPVEAQRTIMVAAGIAFDKATKVLEKTPDGVDRAESLVDHLERFFDTAGAADGE